MFTFLAFRQHDPLETSFTLGQPLFDHAHLDRESLVFSRCACSSSSAKKSIGDTRALVDTDRVVRSHVELVLIEFQQVPTPLSPHDRT